MVRFNNKVFKISALAVILLLLVWFIREFSLSIVSVDEEGARVEINFIFPMDKETINNSIYISPEIPNSEFDCKVEWKSDHNAVIYIKEKDHIKGQKVNLLIKNAKTRIPGIKKSVNTSIQFQKNPKIVGLNHYENIPTDEAIIIKFNTPMKRANINKYIESDVQFEIMPVEGSNDSQWRLSPKEPLENNKNYIISFRKGMPARSGMFLEEDELITLKTAPRPEVVSILPENNSRWIGIYPNIIVESKDPIERATIKIENERIEGEIHDERWARFSLPNVLDFETTYEIEAEITSIHGEKSDIYKSKFSTIPIEEDRLWVEVILRDKHKVLVYKGKKLIREMPCSGGTDETPTVLGTYYLQDRGPKFFARKISEGANYWVRIHGNYLFHGLPRNEDWVISREAKQKLGYPASHGCIRLREVDAKWFYDNVPQNTMVIIHK
ncbi:MAG: L,D-transpeptidase [Epulopiscium sp.]|nr:L,D-transpeptidase [Candidatus Epulonipiscium sp.]